ncbi:MAG TPA: hypothetical protein DCE78_01395 [Bacteroidetes bacterium]|nr:hypothetical protein [Bacteroidota bacterium]
MLNQAKSILTLMLCGVMIFPLVGQSMPFYITLAEHSSTLSIAGGNNSEFATPNTNLVQINLGENVLKGVSTTAGLSTSLKTISVGYDSELALTVPNDDSPALATLKSRFAEPIYYRAELSHQFTDAYTGETTSSYGSIWFSKDMYKIDTPDQLILVRDLISTVYNKSQNKVIISQYDPEADDFAPSRYFSGNRDSYNSTDIINEDGTKTIKIIADDAFELFTEVDIKLSRDGNPVQIDAVDQMENTIRTTFRFGRFEKIQEAVFTISYPSDAEIVDMRP